MCSTCDCEKNPIKGVDQEEAASDDPIQAKCRKCEAKPFIVLDKIHIDCKQCFLESCNRKVRSTIGRSMLMKHNDSILIAHSGGPSSTALLSMIKDIIDGDTRRNQKFRPSILHVDTGSALGLDFEQGRKKRLLQLSKLLKQTHEMYPDWPLYWTTLEISLSIPDASKPLCIRYDPQSILTDLKYDFYLNNPRSYNELQDNVQKSKDLTEKQCYIHNSTTGLINMVASALNALNTTNSCDQFKFVYVASSATQLANNLLVNVILGEGSTIASTVNVCDRRPLVPIFRPMRDFSKKEIVFYLRAKCLEFNTRPNVATLVNRKASIQKVTETFLSKLFIDYPSTYSTLLRTGSKMQD